MTRRRDVLPKRTRVKATPAMSATASEGVITVSIHDEVTRDYAANPPTE